MSERRSTGAKLNPTLFDKLLVDPRALERVDRGRSDIVSLDKDSTQLRLGGGDLLQRFNEKALRNTVRRELNWLLNTTQLEAVQDLGRYPHVRTSVLNYGVPDMTGRVSTPAALKSRGDDLRRAITTFEPRIDPKRLDVEVRNNASRDNAVSFLIRGDVTSAVKAMPVQYVADVEIDTGAARVRD